MLKIYILRDISKCGSELYNQPAEFHMLSIYIEILHQASIVVTYNKIDYLLGMFFKLTNKSIEGALGNLSISKSKILFAAADLETLKKSLIEKAKELQDENIRELSTICIVPLRLKSKTTSR
jgi:hypothetical protein